MIGENRDQDAPGKKNRPDATTCFEGRRAKQVLMSLPEGILLQSNVAFNPLAPVLEGVLGPMESRDALWHSLKDLRVDGRLF